MEDLSAMFDARCREKGISFGYNLSPDIPQLLIGDPNRLRQILMNLIGNALKFTGEGSIQVKVELVARYKSDLEVKFIVTDTGIGITEDRQEHLFEKFTQVDGATTRQYGGTGLGLAISKQLTDLMGGRIGLESELQKGSSFWFTVRLGVQSVAHSISDDKLPPVKVADPGQHKPNDFSGKSALVVEDNAINQRLIKILLQKLGFTVTLAENGVVAISALQKATFDVVLMDMQMPEMDGLEATRRIRDPGSGAVEPDLTIIAMTANAMQGDREACLEAGMNDYLSKPVKRQELIDMLGKWLATTS